MFFILFCVSKEKIKTEVGWTPKMFLIKEIFDIIVYSLILSTWWFWTLINRLLCLLSDRDRA